MSKRVALSPPCDRQWSVAHKGEIKRGSSSQCRKLLALRRGPLFKEDNAPRKPMKVFQESVPAAPSCVTHERVWAYTPPIAGDSELQLC